MHRNFLICSFSFFVLFGYAQNQRLIDSLLIGTKTTTTDSLKAECHYELCYQWADYNFDSAMFHATRMADIAESSGNDLIRYQSLNAKGLAFDYSSQFDSAILFYDLAGKLAKNIDYVKGQAVAKFNIGVVHYYAGEMELAIYNYLLAEEVYTELDDQRNLSRLYNNLGLIYRQTKKYNLAEETYLKSLTIKRKLPDISGVMATLTNLSAVYQYLEKYDEAIVASNEVIELAKASQNEGAHIFELMNLAKCYQAKEEDTRAFNLYKDAEKMLDKKSNYPFVVDIYQNLSEHYLQEKNVEQTKKYLDLVEQEWSED